MNKDNINLVIAARSFIQRLGIKSLLNVIGIDCQIIEVETLSDLLTIHNFISGEANYIIISDDIIDCNQQILKILNTYSDARIMINCKNLLEDIEAENIFCLPFSYSKNEIINEFKEFLTTTHEEQEVSDSSSSLLSDREADVLKLIAQGLSNKEIASKLFISINTVITHRKHITEKLDIKTIAGLTVYAIINNYINPDDVTQ